MSWHCLESRFKMKTISCVDDLKTRFRCKTPTIYHVHHIFKYTRFTSTSAEFEISWKSIYLLHIFGYNRKFLVSFINFAYHRKTLEFILTFWVNLHFLFTFPSFYMLFSKILSLWKLAYCWIFPFSPNWPIWSGRNQLPVETGFCFYWWS